MLITCLLWLAAAGMTWWLLLRQGTQPVAEPAPPPPDPITTEVDRWMHQWDRGRA